MHMDRWQSDFIGPCPTIVEHPISITVAFFKQFDKLQFIMRSFHVKAGHDPSLILIKLFQIKGIYEVRLS